jgi:HEPN domain-containing protein
MTQRERFPPEDPREWLNRAQSNLVHAQMLADGIFFEDLCFDAQQAAEKSIKAVMIARGIDFPYVHDLARLLKLLEKDGEQIPPEIWESQRLTRFAFETRYPGASGPVTQSDYQHALVTAEAVVNWAADRIRMDSAPSE